MNMITNLFTANVIQLVIIIVLTTVLSLRSCSDDTHNDLYESQIKQSEATIDSLKLLVEIDSVDIALMQAQYDSLTASLDSLKKQNISNEKRLKKITANYLRNYRAPKFRIDTLSSAMLDSLLRTRFTH